MRKLSAHYIFDGHQWHRNKVIIINEQGIITHFKDAIIENKELHGIEFYNGILCPGFVNAHVHLELSFLKDKFTAVNSLPDFIEQMKKTERTFSIEKEIIAQTHDQLMYQNGISVCGDISNTSLTSIIKKQSKIYYHTFCELYSVDEERADIVYHEGLNLSRLFHPSSITPHAPYSVSYTLLQNIVKSASAQNIFSIHFKESQQETELFNRFQQNFPASENPSLEFIKYLPKSNHCLFVHQTFVTEAEVNHIVQYFENPFFVLCPNSNLFIEKTLPPYFLIKKYSDKICIGTDSLASNRQLSILDELKTLSFSYPKVPLEQWLQMATINGAIALKVNHQFGTIKPGTAPGIVLIENVDLHKMCLTSESVARRIV